HGRAAQRMSNKSDKQAEQLAEGTLISHLLELRDRLVKAVIGVALLFAPALVFKDELFSLLLKPMVQVLPEGSSPIATEVLSPFLAPIKLAFFAALFGAMPWVLYQIW